MITIEEKIKIAKEIGMETWAQENEIKLEMEKEGIQLTALKIKPITLEEIRNKICPEAYFHIYDDKYADKRPWHGWCLFGETWIKNRFPMETLSLDQWTDNIPYGALLAVQEAKKLGLSDFKIHFPVTPKRQRLKIDPLITGVIGKKLKRYWYASSRECPILHSSEVGIGRHSHVEEIHPGKMFEVFSWDDGKIYE